MLCNAKGFTLIEAMIAILLLTVMMLASVVALVSIKDRNVENVIRQEAVKLGQELVNDTRNQPYSIIPNGTTDSTVTRHGGGFDITFAVNQVVADLLPIGNAKSVIFTITWTSASMTNANKTYVTRTLVGNR